MSVKQWSVKPGELRRLSRAARLVWAARCAMRVEPWRPPGVASRWNQGLRLIVDGAFGDVDRAVVKRVARELGDLGAEAVNRRDGTKDEARGRCMGYACEVLGASLEATLLDDGAALVKAVIDAARYAGSIPAVLAHAGLVRAPRGKDPVDFAAGGMWDAMRSDLAACAGIDAGQRLSVAAVRRLAPIVIARGKAFAAGPRGSLPFLFGM